MGSMKRAICRGGRLQRGQSFVEFAISLVFFLIVLIGLFDLGRAYYIHVALEDSAGEASLYLAINHTCPRADSGPGCADPNNAMYRARNASSLQINWDSVTILPDYPTDPVVGDMVKVRMEYPFKLFTPIITTIVGGDTIKLSAEAQHAIIRP